MKPPFAGPIVGGLMAVVMIALLIMLFASGDSAYSLYAAVLITLVVLGPLLLANLVLTVVYLARKTVPGKTFAWMWLPPMLIVFSLPILESLEHQKSEAFRAAHPDIREVHINLSGRSLWLDPEAAGHSSKAELPGTAPERFLSLTRYADAVDKLAAYKQARLADDYREISVFLGPPHQTQATVLPVLRPTPFPAVERLVDRMSFKGGEASVIEYAYYHYTDRVEVVPTIKLSGSQDMDLWGSGLPVVDFHLANLTALPLARLEIDGQGIALGEEAFAPEDARCTSRNYSAHAITRLDKPLTVRWQFAEANPAWHEASVAIRGFGPGRVNGRIRSTSVDLYFQKDGSVVGEASQLIDQPGQKLALRTHAPLPLIQEPPCGHPADRYSDAVSVYRE